MVKILFKKQMQMIFANFFQNKKNGKSRSKAAIIGSIILFSILMIGALGYIFFMLADTLCAPLCAVGYDWFYLALMELVAMALGIFGSVFNTYASLYQAKDNDLLFSLPIPVRAIMMSRLLGVYAMGVMYSAVVMAPALVVYYMNVTATASVIVCSIIVYLMLTFFLLVVSCGLGWIIAKISSKIKNKSIVTVFVSIAFLAAYYFCYFKANTWLNEMLKDAMAYGDSFKGKAYPLYALGMAGTGSVKFTFLVSIVIVVMVVLVYAMLNKSFLKLATTSVGEKAVDYHTQKVKVRTVKQAILFKERKRYLSNANYMLNSSLGLLFFAVAAVAVLLKGSVIKNGIAGLVADMDMPQGESVANIVALLCIVALALMQGFVYITAPAVSLEGKNIWILQSLPVKPWDILKQKLKWHILLADVASAICSICVIIAIRPSVAMSILVVIIPLCMGVFYANLGLLLNLLMPNLKWTNETAVVKQSAPLFIIMLIGMVLPIGLFYSFYKLVESAGCMGVAYVWLAFFALASLIMLLWLKYKGTKIWLKL